MHQQDFVSGFGERHPSLELLPPLLDRPVVVPQGPDGLGELGYIAVLVEGVAGVRGQAAEQIGPEHRRDHGPEAAARLALDAPMAAVSQRAVASVDERDDVLAEIGVVATRSRGVDELRASVGRPGVDVDDDAGRGLAAGEQAVGGFGERQAVGAPVGPHRHGTGVALDNVNRRIPLGRAVVVAGGHVHPERALNRVAQGVAFEGPTVDRQPVDSPRPLRFPWRRHLSHGMAAPANSRSRRSPRWRRGVRSSLRPPLGPLMIHPADREAKGWTAEQWNTGGPSRRTGRAAR